MRPLPSANTKVIALKNRSNDLLQNENNFSTGEDQIEISDNEEIKKENALFSLAKSLPYIVYCASQMVFLAGFLTSQLYIVPYAVQEVSVIKSSCRK